MTRTRGSASKDLGRRAFGTAGGWAMSRETPERPGEVIDLEERDPAQAGHPAGAAGLEAPRGLHPQLSSENHPRRKVTAYLL